VNAPFDRDARWLADQPDPAAFEIALWSHLDLLAILAVSVADHPQRVV
jgi:hypothetical protein